jgi:hypothetical protein
MRKIFPEIMAACLLCCAFVATAALTACGDADTEVSDQPFERTATEAGASQTVV